MLAKQEVQKARVYLAAPFFTHEEVARVERVEAALEDNPFVESYFSPRLNQIEHLTFGTKEWRKAVFDQDINRVNWATVLVVIADHEEDHSWLDEQHELHETWVDTDTDSGTSFEVGYAYATGKPIIVLHETIKPLNLMISDSLHAYFKKANDIADYNFLKMPKTEYKGVVI